MKVWAQSLCVTAALAAVAGATPVRRNDPAMRPVFSKFLLLPMSSHSPYQRQVNYVSWGYASLAQPDPGTERAAPVDPARDCQDMESAVGPCLSTNWKWKEEILLHFTKPPYLADSAGARRLLKAYQTSVALPAQTARRQMVYAGFTGAAYDLSAAQPAETFDEVPVNLLPEPSPLILLATGLTFILLGRGFRRVRKPN